MPADGKKVAFENLGLPHKKGVAGQAGLWYTKARKYGRSAAKRGPLRPQNDRRLFMKGFAFRLTGLILGIIGAAVSVTAIVFSAIGMSKARQCKNCKLGGHIK